MLRYIPIIALAVLMLPAPVGAQPQQPSIGIECVPASQLGAMRQTKVYVDGDEDEWLVVENTANGESAIGFLLKERGMFCITAKRTARPGQRGA